MSGAYYNELEPFAADWLENLIAAGHIAPGVVDRRDIRDVHPDDLRGFTQCHFFAGIGVWSYALRRAGWPDDRPVWTGSCPCQPFSSAGRRGGTDDERHLWPAWFHLLEVCRPPVVFGEQVASKDGLGWLDLVSADLEGAGYAWGAEDRCAAGYGAPHIRQRLFFGAYDPRSAADWLADAERYGQHGSRDFGPGGRDEPTDGSRASGRLVHGVGAGLEGHAGHGDDCGEPGRDGADAAGPVASSGGAGGLADGPGDGPGDGRGEERPFAGGLDPRDQPEGGSPGFGAGSGDQRPRPTDGFWRDADWLYCRDGKWRPVEPQPQSLADGSAPSLGRVRPGIVQDLELEVAEWAIRYERDAGEALLGLRSALSAAAELVGAAGRFPDLHEAPFLLALLCQLDEQGWAFSERVPRESPEVAESRLRVLRHDDEAPRASCGRGLDEQQSGECPDPLRVLSSILAFYASEAWAHAHRAYAPVGFPLERGAFARVGRLRAYGNAIVAPVAEEFIRDFQDALREAFGPRRGVPRIDLSAIPAEFEDLI